MFVLPDGVVVAFVAVLVVSGGLLMVFGGAGFGQGPVARVVQVLGGLFFLSFAAVVVFVDRSQVGLLPYMFAGPVLAAGNILRERRARRIAEDQLAATYLAEARDRLPGESTARPDGHRRDHQ